MSMLSDGAVTLAAHCRELETEVNHLCTELDRLRLDKEHLQRELERLRTEETMRDEWILAGTCRQLAMRMQDRVEMIEERDGAAAVTGPGVGISYLFAKEIADALKRAAEKLDEGNPLPGMHLFTDANHPDDP